MSAYAWRLDSGGRIDRTQRLSFRFDGIAYEGFAGDTLASALLASGVRIAGRSFKLHRPRGLFGSWCESVGCTRWAAGNGSSSCATR